MGRLARLASTLKRNYQEEKARLTGTALSKARLLLQAKEIPQLTGKLGRPGKPQPIPGASIRTSDGAVLTFFTDGSLRSALGPKPDVSGRQFKKRVKMIRRQRKATAAKKAVQG